MQTTTSPAPKELSQAAAIEHESAALNARPAQPVERTIDTLPEQHLHPVNTGDGWRKGAWTDQI